MRWFGRKGGGAARPALARVMAGAAIGGEWPRSYEAQVRDAYAGNAVAQRAVRMVAEPKGRRACPCYGSMRRGRRSGESRAWPKMRAGCA